MKINHTELRSFFYGTLLGDSYIHKGVFYCKQISEDLIRFKAKIIEQSLPDAKVSIKEKEALTDKNGVHHQKHWILSASHSVYIKELEKLFYPNGKKIYPHGVVKRLTPLGLAMWYADDGTTILVGYNNTTGSAKNRRVDFCTDNFTYEEQLIIKDELQSLGIEEISLIKRGDNYRVRIGTKSRQDFLISIGDYFLKYFPSLSYKLDLGYRGTSLTNRRYVSEKYHNFYLQVRTCPSFKDRIALRSEDIV